MRLISWLSIFFAVASWLAIFLNTWVSYFTNSGVFPTLLQYPLALLFGFIAIILAIIGLLFWKETKFFERIMLIASFVAAFFSVATVVLTGLIAGM